MMQSNAYLNRIATAVPDHEVHQFYLRFGASQLADHPQTPVGVRADDRSVGHRAPLFVLCAGRRPAGRRHRPRRHLRQGLVCRHRKAHGDVRGGRTGARAEGRRPASGRRGPLADHASDRHHAAPAFRRPASISNWCSDAACRRRSSAPSSASWDATPRSTRLKLSRHIVRSDPKARVLIVNIELCTLHLRETTELEKLISFCLWGDGCAASLVTAEPHGILLESFHAIVAAERRELMSWHIRDDGFDMVLSGQVPGAIRETLRDEHRGHSRRQVRRRDRSVGGASRRPLGARRGRAGA